jgi:hypothetical protein
MSFNGAPVVAASVVGVDVGKSKAVLSMTSTDRRRLFCPAEFAMTSPALAAVLKRVSAVLPAAPAKVGVEAAGHSHRRCLDRGFGRRAGRFWSSVLLGLVSSSGQPGASLVALQRSLTGYLLRSAVAKPR